MQSELVDALGNSNTYSYPRLNLLNFPGPYHSNLLSQLNFIDYSTNSSNTFKGKNDTEMCVAKCRWMSDNFITELSSSAVLFSSFKDSGFLISSVDICFWVCMALHRIFLFGFQQFTI